MDPTPSKRRKISPTSSIPITTKPIQTRPLSRDGDFNFNSSSRASFMSPTKASLARFNPSLLPRSKSLELHQPVSQGSDTQSQGSKGSRMADVYDIPGTEMIANGATRTPSRGANRAGLRALPRRRSRTPGGVASSGFKPRPTMPVYPRASPPAGDAGKGDVSLGSRTDGVLQNEGEQNGTSHEMNLNPTAATSHLTTPPPDGLPRKARGITVSSGGEPNLPSTPVYLGIEKLSERRSEELFSSPSRRPKRRNAGSAKFSPLKPQDPPPKEPTPRSRKPFTTLGQRVYIAGTPRPPPTAEETGQIELRETLDALKTKLKDLEDELVQQMLVSNWQAENSKEGKGVAKRQKDVSQTASKVTRCREELAEQQQTMLSGAPVEDEMMDGVRRPNPLAHQEPTPPLPQSLAERLAHFLPFSIPHPNPPLFLPPDPSNQYEISSTPFTILTTNSSIPPPSSTTDLSYSTTLTLTTPHAFLRAKINLRLALPAQTISTLHLLGLSPWADPELGAYLRALPSDSTISTLGTAFGHYYETAHERAQCFMLVSQEFPRLVDNPQQDSGLNAYLGRQDVAFSRDDVMLEIAWLVSFHDDGRVESRISAKAGFPDAWRRKVGRELDRVSEVFGLLVQEKGAVEAASVVCGLVFPA